MPSFTVHKKIVTFLFLGTMLVLRVDVWLHDKCIKKLENCMNDFIAVDQCICQVRPSFTANDLLVASAAHEAVEYVVRL